MALLGPLKWFAGEKERRQWRWGLGGGEWWRRWRWGRGGRERWRWGAAAVGMRRRGAVAAGSGDGGGREQRRWWWGRGGGERRRLWWWGAAVRSGRSTRHEAHRSPPPSLSSAASSLQTTSSTFSFAAPLHLVPTATAAAPNREIREREREEEGKEMEDDISGGNSDSDSGGARPLPPLADLAEGRGVFGRQPWGRRLERMVASSAVGRHGGGGSGGTRPLPSLSLRLPSRRRRWEGMGAADPASVTGAGSGSDVWETVGDGSGWQIRRLGDRRRRGRAAAATGLGSITDLIMVIEAN
ncbi:hypothetical protein [Oryza sativa Japonica Group]|uniref:Uncharacterized protein P0035F12.4 n=1 Tax=Oryza sativa subsp. japonica TaxID=39947 RepID=Q5N8V8_ORYSJ|nr:hypothetical protein [Oryza sativa Japonica Group]